MLHLLRTNRDIRLLFSAQVISFLGDWFVFVALAGYVDDVTDSELLVSLVLVSMSLPSFLASPLAGPVVDRVDRQRLLVVVSLAQAAAASGLLLLSADRVWVAFLFQGTVAALAAFVKPAIDAAVPNLARTPDELRAANALLGSTWGVMLAVGAGLGGLFSQAFGRRAAIVADVVTFLVAAALIALIGRPLQRDSEARGQRPVRPVADMREAIAVAREDPVILALMSSKATFAIGAGVVSQLAVLASEVHGSGDRGRGLLIAARGLGAGLGPIVAARWVAGRPSPGAHALRLGGDPLRWRVHRHGVGADPRPRPRLRHPRPLRWRRPVDPVDVRAAAARRRRRPRAGDGRRLRDRHPRAQRHQRRRRRALVGDRCAVGDHHLRRRGRGCWNLLPAAHPEPATRCYRQSLPGGP